MAVETIGLRAVVEGADKYVRDLKEMRREEQRLAQTTQQVDKQTDSAFSRQKFNRIGQSATKAGGIMSASLTAPIAGVGFTALSAAADFEQGMNQVQAVTGATAGEMDQMSELTKELGRSTRFSASEATEGMNFLAMAGFEVDEAMGALPGTLELATAANMDLGRAADIASNVLTGYGMEADEISRVNDVFAKAMSSANVTVGEMGESMKMVAPVAASAGLEFEETSAMIAGLGDAGIKGTQAGTMLRGAMSKLLSPTGKAKDAIAELGLETTDSQGNLLSMENIIRQLEDSGASTAQMMELFGLRAGPGMAALVEQGADSLGEMKGELRDSGGTAEELADVQMEGLTGALRELRSAWEGFGIAVAEAGLLDFATDLVGKVTDVVSNLAEANPEILKLGSVIAGIAAAAGPTLVALGSFSLLIGAISGPVLAASAAAAGLAAILATLAVDAEKLPDPLRRIVEPAQMIAESMPAVAAGIGAVIAAIAVKRVLDFATAMGSLVDQMLMTQGMGGTMSTFGRRLKSAMMTPMGAIGAVSLAVVGLDQGLRAVTGDGIIGNVQRLFQGVDHAAEGAAEGVEAFEAALKRAGDEGDPAKVGVDEIESSIRDFERALDDVEGRDFAPGPPGEVDEIRAVREETERYGGEIAGVIESMHEQEVSAMDLAEQIAKLPPEMQDVVKEEIEWKDIQNELVGETRDAISEVSNFTELQELLSQEALTVGDRMSLIKDGMIAVRDNAEASKTPMESYRDVLLDAGLSAEEAEAEMAKYRDTQEEAGEEAEEAKSPLEDYTEGMKDAEDGAGDLQDALADLTSAFGEANPQVIANNAEIARLEIQKAKLLDKDRELTEAEEAQVEAVEGQIESLQRQNDVFTSTADAYNPIIRNTQTLTGATDDQAFAFSQAMLKYVEDGEKGVGILTDVNEALANTDAESAIRELGDIRQGMEDSLGPAATEEIFRELGPVIGSHFEDASPEVIALAKELGIPIPGAIQEGVDEKKEEDLHPVETMRTTYGSRETQEEWTRTGRDTGHQYVAGLQAGVDEESGNVDKEEPLTKTYGSKGTSDAALRTGRDTGHQYMAGMQEGTGTEGDISGISQAVEDAIEAVTGGQGEITDAQGAIIGRGILGGMETGLGDEGARQRVANEAASLSDLISDPVKNILGIGSPSRLMADEVGRPIVQGIVVGMQEESAQMSDTARTMLARLSDTVTQGMDEFGQISGDRAKHAVVQIRNVLQESGGSLTEETRVMAQNFVESWGTQVDRGMDVNGQRMRELMDMLREDLRAGAEGAMEGVGEGVENSGGVVAEAARNTMGSISDTLIESMKEVGSIGGDEATSMLNDIGAVIQMSPLDDQMRANAMSMLDAWRSEVQTGMNINEEELLTLIQDLGFEVQTGIEDVAEDTAGALDDFAGGMAVGTLSDIIDNARGVGREGARSIVDDFVGTLEESRLEDEMTEKFGDVGGDVATALGEALADPEGRGGATLARHVESLLDKAREEGVEGIEGLGDDLIENLTLALEDGSDEAADRALEILGKITGAIEEESPKISKELGEGFEEGMLTAEEVLTGWHEKLGKTLEQGNELTEGNTKEMFSNLKTVLRESDVPEEFRTWAGGTISDMAEEFENGGDIAEEEVRELIERIGTAVGMADEECEGLCEAGEKCSCGGGEEWDGPGQAPSDRPRLGRPGSGGLIAPAAPAFDVGAWSVPEDMLAQIHAGEMIIPADAANTIRELMVPSSADTGGGETRIEQTMSPTFVAQGQTEEEMRHSLYNAVDEFMRQRRTGSINSGVALSAGIG